MYERTSLQLFALMVAGWIACANPAVAQQGVRPATNAPSREPREDGALGPDSGQDTAAASNGAPAGSGKTTPAPDLVREARERFDHGLELYRDGDYELALIEFDRAYELVPDYRVLYNIAQVSMMLGNYTRARLALEQYLREGEATIAEDRRESVAKDLAMLSGRTATLLVTCNQPGAEVLVGEEVVGKTPMSSPVLLDAGTHTVTVRLQGFQPASKRLTLAGRDAAEITLDLRPVPVKERERIVVEKRLVTRPSDSAPATPALVWAGWIATGALATGAAVTGVLGVNAASELKSLQNDPDAKRRELTDTEGRASTLFLAADLLGAAAVLTGGATLYFTVFRSNQGTPPGRDAGGARAAVGLSMGGVLVRGNF